MSVIIKTSEMQYKDNNGVYHGVNAIAEKKIADQVAALDAAIDAQESRISTDISQMQSAVDDIESQRQTMIAAIASVAGQGTDTTLTQSGVAADAKTVGDEVSDLKSAIDSTGALNAVWEQGRISTSGADVASSYAIRFADFYHVGKYRKIEVIFNFPANQNVTDIYCYVAQYNTNNVSGFIETSTIKASDATQTLVLNANTNYIRVYVRAIPVDTTIISVADSAYMLMFFTDGTIAKVRDQIQDNIDNKCEINKNAIVYNNLLFLMPNTRKSTHSSGGVDYTVNVAENTISASGTSNESGSSFPFLSTGSSVPGFISIGDRLFLEYSSTDDDIRFQMLIHRNNSWEYDHKYSANTVIDIPSDADDIGFRLVIDANKSISGTVKAKLYKMPILYTETMELSAMDYSDKWDNEVEVYTDLEQNNNWWKADGSFDSVSTHKHSQLLPVRPSTAYYTGLKIDGYESYGAFFDRNGEYISSLLTANLTEYEYKLPDGTDMATTRDYTKLYTFTTPSNAYFFSLNFNRLAQFLYCSYVASKPVFAWNGTGNTIIKKDDALYQKTKNRKLCVIGTSQIMIDRLNRTGKFDGPDSEDASQYIVGVQEYLIPWWNTVDSYGYSDAPMMYKSSEDDPENPTTKSIYTRVVTDQLDLSGYDDFFIGHSTSGLTSSNVGTLTGYDDLGSNTTFIGALRQIIAYIYTQNPKANIFVQTRIIRSAFSNPTTYNNTLAANEQIRNMAKMLALTCVDTANESGFNYYVAPHWCYDNGGHPNQLGNKMIGLAMRKTMIGI